MKRVWLLLALLTPPAGAAERLSIAAAANLVYALDALTAEFKRLEPATEVTVVTGASGSLVAQVQNGAPFDVFLSADLEYPEKLIAAGQADAKSLTKFAVGRLVLWTTRPGIDVSSVPALVRDARVKKLAVANLTTAPYGRAAREVLGKLGLWAEAEAKVVIGENITQTAQFVETGNADAGFVALSLVLSPKLKDRGRWQEIDPALYSPLEQGAVITKQGGGNPAAARFLAFLGRPEARAVFERFGYRVPQRLAASRDVVQVLLARVAAKEVTFTGSDREILRGVLQALAVPVESQVAVFSRGSLQAGLIRPSNPRVLYFSDTTYVGWVPGGLIEVATISGDKGPVFYAFDPQDARDQRRTFVRETSCVRCHGGNMTDDNPGLFARSVFAAENGDVLRPHGSELITEQTPFERRWGGWYVTGYHGPVNHRGNAFSRERDGRLDFTPSEQRPMELTAFFESTHYPAATSDVVALLVFEHQLAMHNSLARAAKVARWAAESGPASAAETESALARAAEDVLDHLLFRDAAPLPTGVQGSEAFRAAFAAGAPRSGRGEALKDLSLQGRLFANRCSFLIYSRAFTELPVVLKDRIIARLKAALRDESGAGRYSYLEKEERRRIAEILIETHPDLRGG